MNRDPFQSFIDLIQFDQQIYSLKQQIEQSNSTLDKIDQEEQLLAGNVTQAQQRGNQAKKTVDERELEMKLLEEQERTKKNQLDNLKNPKDYFSLNADLEHIKKKQHALEDEIIQAWHTLEQAKRALDQIKKEVEDKRQQLEGSKNQQKALREQSLEQLKRIEDSRPEKLVGIPDEWLEKYSAMRERIPDPVVPVQSGSCSACFHSLVARDIQLLNKRALLQCRGCFRFLYIPGTVDVEQGA